nr:TnsD family Tn7-like transposition protein [Salinibacter altiplanensis]
MSGESSVELPDRFAVSALQIAKDSLWLLQNPDMGDGTLLQRHRDWQFARGWQHERAPHRGNFNFKGFLQAIRNHYDEEFLRVLCEDKTSLLIAKTGGWVRQLTMLQNEARAYPPLQHILLWQFLGLTVREFVQEPTKPMIPPEPEKSKSQLTLDGPCSNVACEQYDPPIPRILNVSEEEKDKRFTISCPVCDFSYTQRPSCDDPCRIRIKQTGDLWDSRLRELLEQTPALSLAELTNEIGFSQSTIQKHALRLDLWRSKWKDSVKQSVDSTGKSRRRKKAARHRNRQKWLKLRDEFPEESRSELRKRMPRVGSYLSKYDTHWYDEHSPEKGKKWSRERRKKWERCDDTTLAEMKEIVAEMIQEDPPVRITLHSLSTRLGQISTLQSRLRRGKLPNTEKFVDQVVEGRRDYALRRLCSAVSHYASESELPPYRDFTDKASMDSRSYPELASSAYAALTAHIEEQECIPEQWKTSDSEIWGES